MDLVVVGIGEPLDLVVEGEAQLIADMMGDGFAEIVLQEREQAAGDGHHQDGDGAPQQRLFSTLPCHGQDVLGLVDGLAEQARDAELENGGDDRGADGDGDLKRVAQRQQGDAQQRALALARMGGGDMGRRVAARAGAAGLETNQGNDPDVREARRGGGRNRRQHRAKNLSCHTTVI